MTTTSRRAALRTLAMGSVGTGFAVAGGAACAMGRDEPAGPGVRRRGRAPTTFVVVGGASGTPGGINELALRGHRSVAVDLPGHRATDGQFALDYQCPQDAASLATRPSPMAGITLDDFAAAAVDVVRTVAGFGPVVVYGGSMGGATLNRVGNEVPELVDHIVYDSAFCPVELACADDYLATPEAADTLAAGLAGLVVADPSAIGALRANYRTADPAALAAVKEAFMAGADDGEFHQMLATLQPDESLTLGSDHCPADADTWGTIPRTYIRHQRDRMIPLALQDRMIDEADRLTPDNRFHVHTIDAPHAATAAQFAEVIDILDGLAA